MNNFEKLMLEFPELEYKFEKTMPYRQKGLYIDNIVYLNPNQTDAELTSTIAEEIAHHYTSVGNILDYRSTESRKQERKARLTAAEITVHPTHLIEAYKNGCREYWEVAEELGITVKALMEAIELFKDKYGDGFTYENYKILFGKADSMEVVKIS